MLFGIIDDFFSSIEGKKEITTKTIERKKKPLRKNRTKTPRINKEPKAQSLSGADLFYKYFIQARALKGLEGWKDDKEAFVLDLLNDIKDGLFKAEWQKGWTPALALSNKNGGLMPLQSIHHRPYGANNAMGLKHADNGNPFFITLAAAAVQGGTIADKKKARYILSWIPVRKDEEGETSTAKDETATNVIPKFDKVINVEYVDNIKKPRFKVVAFEKKELNHYCKNIIEEFEKQKRLPKLYFDQVDRCYYSPSDDEIHMVDFIGFKKIEEYFSTLFHEIIHSTKATKRLGRKVIKESTGFGSEGYAYEELVAEMGAFILCSELGLKYTRVNTVAYLRSWLKGTKAVDVDKALLTAYADSCKAVEYLLEGIDVNTLVPDTMKNRVGEVEPTTTEAPKEKPEPKPIKEEKPESKPEPKPKGKGKGKIKPTRAKIADKTVKTSVSEAIKDVLTLSKYKGLTAIPAGLIFRKFKEETKVKISELSEFDRAFLEKLFDLKMVDYDSNYWSINDFGIEFIKAVKGRIESLKGKKYGNTLFPNMNGLGEVANIEPTTIEQPANEVNNEFSNLGFGEVHNIQKGEMFQLKGDLGELLGEFDRQCYSIALRGEKGAGKSRLAFQFIDEFLNLNFSVGFISLEMHPEGSVFINYRDTYINPKNKEKLKATTNALDYDGLNSACKLFDVIVIDSWTKLRGMDQKDFDRLQKENPTTIILAIFQSTTGKVTRGGNMPEYDAGTVIQVNEGGLAVCEKNRYKETGIVYNVFEQKLVRESEGTMNG
jgi:antirestriction protein ArdC